MSGYGEGLPPAGGWKRHMVEDDEYAPEYQDEYRRLWHEAAGRVAGLEAALRAAENALDWIEAEPDDPVQVQLWARAALAGLREPREQASGAPLAENARRRGGEQR